MTLTVERRQEIEREIVTKVLQTAIDKGLIIEMWNGGDEYETKGNNLEEMVKYMFATDSETVIFFKAFMDQENLGMIHFVYGNTGFDVIADHTSDELTESIVESVQDLVQKYELEAV